MRGWLIGADSVCEEAGGVGSKLWKSGVINQRQGPKGWSEDRRMARMAGFYWAAGWHWHQQDNTHHSISRQSPCSGTQNPTNSNQLLLHAQCGVHHSSDHFFSPASFSCHFLVALTSSLNVSAFAFFGISVKFSPPSSSTSSPPTFVDV